MIKNGVLALNVCNGICNNFIPNFLISIQFKSMETCFILRIDIAGVITFLNENKKNRNNKTQVTAI